MAKRPRLLITRRIPEPVYGELLEHFAVDYYNKDTAIGRSLLLRRAAKTEALLCVLTEKIDEDFLKKTPCLRMVSTYSVGYDHIDVNACTGHGIAVAHTPGVLTETCADFTFALMLAAARRLVEGDRLMRVDGYKGWDPLMLLGADVFGKTIGIVGFGRIGQAVARRALGFGMTVLYFDTQKIDAEAAASLKAQAVGLEELLKRSDFVSIHAALNRDTWHLMSIKQFRLMKKSAYLINTARGPIVDEKALVTALKSGWIRGAALDVYENEPKMVPGLARLPNTVLMPHLASATLQTRTDMARLAAQALIEFIIHGRAPRNMVNPEVLMKFPIN